MVLSYSIIVLRRCAETTCFLRKYKQVLTSSLDNCDKMILNACGRFLIESMDTEKISFRAEKMSFQLKSYLFSVHTFY
jgi:hypothetical protein